MAAVIIPVLLCFFLGPGVGQLYNRDYKKGALLIVASLILLVIAGVWYWKTLGPYLPQDLTNTDPQALQQIMMNAATHISSEKGMILAAFQALMVVLWIFGMVDAYRVADKKRGISE
jgi:hypothetical protein